MTERKGSTLMGLSIAFAVWAAVLLVAGIIEDNWLGLAGIAAALLSAALLWRAVRRTGPT